MKYIVSVKITYQANEDTWERAAKVRTFEDTNTISDIMGWVYRVKGDVNTVKIHENGGEEATND